MLVAGRVLAALLYDTKHHAMLLITQGPMDAALVHNDDGPIKKMGGAAPGYPVGPLSPDSKVCEDVIYIQSCHCEPHPTNHRRTY